MCTRGTQKDRGANRSIASKRPGWVLDVVQRITRRNQMTTARDIMSANAECARPEDTLVDAARKMRDLDVGALPICGEDERLRGVITDRDIVTNCVANGGDPNAIKVEEYAAEEVITIGADDSIEETLRTMTQHGVRRLPVIDGDQLVGIVSQADVARCLSEGKVGQLVAAISRAPSTSGRPVQPAG